MLVNILKSHFINIKSSRTQKRIIVIESDDCGIIRITSKTALDFLSIHSDISLSELIVGH